MDQNEASSRARKRKLLWPAKCGQIPKTEGAEKMQVTICWLPPISMVTAWLMYSWGIPKISLTRDHGVGVGYLHF